MLQAFSRIGAGPHAALLPQILNLFFAARDRSQFGLANVITAVARDVQDPELKWDLEELGGGIAVGAIPSHPAGGGHAPMEMAREEVAIA